MFTVVSEDDGTPLGVVKRGKPRLGDTVWVGAEPYQVTGRDRDVIMARSTGGAPIRAYHDNPSHSVLLRQAGYNPPGDGPASRGGLEDDLPKVTRSGPVFGGSSSFGSSPPAQFPGVHMAPYPTFEGQMSYQPRIWPIFHYRLMIPIMKLEAAYPPRPGTVENYLGEDYEIVKVLETAIMVRPIKQWNMFLVAVLRERVGEKEAGEGIVFVPMSSVSQRQRSRVLLNRDMEKRGYYRRQYSAITMRPRTVVSYFKNRGRI